MSDETEDIRISMAEKTSTVASVRADGVVQRLLHSVRTSKAYRLDADALDDEIKDIHSNTSVKAFKLEGTDGISEASEIRVHLLGGRSRLVSINRELRALLVKTSRVWRTGITYLRTLPELSSLNVKALDDVASVALIEIKDTIESCERLMADTKEALVEIDERQRLIDSWFSLHKQYTFLTLNRGNQNGDKEESPRPRRLPR